MKPSSRWSSGWSLIVLGTAMVLAAAAAVYACIVACNIAAGALLFFSTRGEPAPAAEPVREPPPVPTVAVRGLHFVVEDFPRVDGSTSTHPLEILIGCKALGVPYRWVTQLDGTRWLEPYTPTLSMEPLVAQVRQLIVHQGTHESYVNLIEGRADIILVARQPSPDERDLALPTKVTLDVRPVALDAFVFLLHQDNPVDGLTLQQVRSIYAGRITNWLEVGGKDARINAYQRDPNSGSQELMVALVMRDEALVAAPSEMIGMSMTGPYNQMHSDPNGIAYSLYYYKEQMAPKTNVKLCAIDGVAPTHDHIADRSYPLVAEVYVVVRSDLAAESSAARLRAWLLSPEGQAVVEESGYVPVGTP